MVKDAHVEDKYRDKLLLTQRVTPKQVILPDGRSFLARYERVNRKNLPLNVTVRRSWTIGPGRQRKHKTQQGAGLLGSVFSLGKNWILSGTLAKGLNIGSWAIDSEMVKKVIDEGIKHAPQLYKLGTKKIKKKT